MTGLEALQQLRLPDAWQAEAIRALAAGEDVIVQAPTGAGKTFIFEQYFQQKRGPGQVIYTVPTRALANDKFAEWTRQGWRVGITTGDLAYQADAPLVVATLEAQQSPVHAALYVVDEYQWLADPLRGNHYEGTLLSLPPQTQLLLLSGSVANPGAVRDWLVRLDRGRKVTLIEQRERPVPLDEVEVEGPSRNVPDSISGYWTSAPSSSSPRIARKRRKSRATSPPASRARNRCGSPRTRKTPPVPISRNCSASAWRFITAASAMCSARGSSSHSPRADSFASSSPRSA
jgi:superfamily II RNA helicase